MPYSKVVCSSLTPWCFHWNIPTEHAQYMVAHDLDNRFIFCVKWFEVHATSQCQERYFIFSRFNSACKGLNPPCVCSWNESHMDPPDRRWAIARLLLCYFSFRGDQTKFYLSNPLISFTLIALWHALWLRLKCAQPYINNKRKTTSWFVRKRSVWGQMWYAPTSLLYVIYRHVCLIWTVERILLGNMHNALQPSQLIKFDLQKNCSNELERREMAIRICWKATMLCF